MLHGMPSSRAAPTSSMKRGSTASAEASAFCSSSLSSPFPALESLKFLAGSCTVHIAYYLCIAVAYRNVDMSFAYTIMRGTAPLLTSVFMLLSGHEMPLAGWLGILCLCAGVLTLTRDNIKNGKFNINGALAAVGTASRDHGLHPFRRLRRPGQRESHQLRMLALRHQHVPHQRHPAAEDSAKPTSPISATAGNTACSAACAASAPTA